MIYTITLNPSIDKTIYVDNLKVNSLNKVKETFYSAGGKGINVSKNIATLNGKSTAMGFIGGAKGKFIINKLEELKIAHDFVDIKQDIRENLKIIDKDGNLTEINEKGPFVTKEDVEQLISKIDNTVKKDDVVVLSGSVCQNVDDDIYQRIVKIANRKGAISIVDADKELLKKAIKAKPTTIKPNIHEFCNYFNIKENCEIDILKKKGQELVAKGIKEVMISLGKDGALFICKDKCFKIEPLKIEVKSTVGAGDAMVASLAVGLENNLKDEEKITLAVALASGACLTKATEAADSTLIEKLYKEIVINKEE